MRSAWVAIKAPRTCVCVAVGAPRSCVWSHGHTRDCLVAWTHPRLPGRMDPPATAWSHGPTRDYRGAWTHPRFVGPTHPRSSGGVGMAADSLYERGSIFSFHHTNLVFRETKWALSTGPASAGLQVGRWIYKEGSSSSPPHSYSVILQLYPP